MKTIFRFAVGAALAAPAIGACLPLREIWGLDRERAMRGCGPAFHETIQKTLRGPWHHLLDCAMDDVR